MLSCLLLAPALSAAAGAGDDAGILAACSDVAAQKWIEQSPQECVKLVNSGDARMQAFVGIHFLGASDFKTAKLWLSKAAEQGEPMGQDGLGYLYQSGQGVEKNIKIANEYFLKAAKQGNTDAQFWLGENLIVSGNYEEGARWTGQAARKGSADAQFNLAILYRDGHGVKKDEGYMYFWFTAAAMNGHEKSKELMDKLNAQLPKETLDEVNAFVLEQLENCPNCINER
jgi:TPR repeat protein